MLNLWQRGDASDLEKPLQTQIENNLAVLLGIRFIAENITPASPTPGVSTRSGWTKTIARVP